MSKQSLSSLEFLWTSPPPTFHLNPVKIKVCRHFWQQDQVRIIFIFSSNVNTLLVLIFFMRKQKIIYPENGYVSLNVSIHFCLSLFPCNAQYEISFTSLIFFFLERVCSNGLLFSFIFWKYVRVQKFLLMMFIPKGVCLW